MYEVLAALLAAAAWGLREIIPVLKRRWANRRVRDMKSGWKGIAALNQELFQLRRRTGAKRVVVMKLSNGGGVPRPGNTVYSSVVYESVADDAESLFSRWQEQLVDGPYATMAAAVVGAGPKPTFVETARLLPCSLRSMYEADGIGGSLKFLLGHSPQNWTLYVSIQFGVSELDANGTLALDPQQLDRIREGVSRLRDIIREHNEVLL